MLAESSRSRLSSRSLLNRTTTATYLEFLRADAG